MNSTEGGRVLIDWLAWPCYVANLNGDPLQIRQEAFGVMSVVVPPNSDGLVEVHYESPGAATGTIAAVIAIWIVRLRHLRREPSESSTTPSGF